MTVTASRPSAALSRAEKVALIEQVRAERPDLTGREKAALIGLGYAAYKNLITDPDGAKQAARRDGYKGICEVCGAETKSDGTSRPSPRCGPCSKPEQFWTRDRIIDAIRRFAAVNGRPPFSTEWLGADPVLGYPPATSCYRSSGTPNAPFAKWADAIEAAGFARPLIGKFERTAETRQRISESRTYWTRERIVEAIQAHVATTGEVPLSRDGEGNDLLPCPQTIYKHGWSWPDLVREAGFTPRSRGGGRLVYWTRERIVEAIQAWNERYGAPPKLGQWVGPRDRAFPSLGTVLKNFGRWNLAIEAAGFAPRRPDAHRETKAA